MDTRAVFFQNHTELKYDFKTWGLHDNSLGKLAFVGFNSMKYPMILKLIVQPFTRSLFVC